MRLIDADSIHYTRVLSQQGLNMELAAKVVIDDMPTIDAAPVVHSKWVWIPDEEEDNILHLVCDACKHGGLFEDDNYCHNCGAKMDKNEPNEQHPISCRRSRVDPQR